MTEQSTEALIAEARGIAREYDPAFRFVLTRVIDRLEAVAKDSSTGQQMHAYWQQRAEEAELEKVDRGPSDAEPVAYALYDRDDGELVSVQRWPTGTEHVAFDVRPLYAAEKTGGES